MKEQDNNVIKTIKYFMKKLENENKKSYCVCTEEGKIRYYFDENNFFCSNQIALFNGITQKEFNKRLAERIDSGDFNLE